MSRSYCFLAKTNGNIAECNKLFCTMYQDSKRQCKLVSLVDALIVKAWGNHKK